jgi:hypothetical protein
LGAVTARDGFLASLCEYTLMSPDSAAGAKGGVEEGLGASGWLLRSSLPTLFNTGALEGRDGLVLTPKNVQARLACSCCHEFAGLIVVQQPVRAVCAVCAVFVLSALSALPVLSSALLPKDAEDCCQCSGMSRRAVLSAADSGIRLLAAVQLLLCSILPML